MGRRSSDHCVTPASHSLISSLRDTGVVVSQLSFFFFVSANQPTNQLTTPFASCIIVQSVLFPLIGFTTRPSLLLPSTSINNAISNFGLAFFMCNLSFISHLTIFCTFNGQSSWQQEQVVQFRSEVACPHLRDQLSSSPPIGRTFPWRSQRSPRHQPVPRFLK